MRSQMLILLGLSCTRQVIFYMMLSRFSIHLWHSAFFLWCIWMWTFLKIFPLGVYWVSWMCRLMFFRKCMTFSAIISLDIFSASFPSVSISGTPITRMLIHLELSYILLKFCWFFFILVSLCSWDCIISINLFIFKFSGSFFCQLIYTFETL